MTTEEENRKRFFDECKDIAKKKQMLPDYILSANSSDEPPKMTHLQKIIRLQEEGMTDEDWFMRNNPMQEADAARKRLRNNQEDA